ncbi:indole-3-glycerol phosphate synthase [Chitinophaga skermanii]|uniref:Indole-3-glycerol phosphate synthase n=1 Tax=Chitinophaga skermanii TaxID=331697 RepID=A0A327QF87_9BACT|nr:indole-3-glycerol phosphate synthase TrpC [Chitinophaga skermanii]RAJ02655.1 indole-3-glycerol phosphate synthase [Chitinophaga skermanii]
MANILAEIVAHKHIEVGERKKFRSAQSLEQSQLFQRSVYSMRAFLKAPGKTGIIAEFKRKSPSKGIINDKVTVEQVTTAYAKFGASALSVLTDTNYFGGSTDDVLQARNVNNIPILRKDFIVDEYQIIEARAMGADVILLIAECLTKAEIDQFSTLANNLGMEVLLEVHSATQLEKITEHVHLVGVNNRDLTTFTVDINRSFELAKLIPSSKYKVAESGITGTNEIVQLKQAGFDGFLIGENFMKNANPAQAFEAFSHALTQQLATV